MPHYMIVLREDPTVYLRYSPEEMQKTIEKYRAWRTRLTEAKRYLGGNKLVDEGGKVMRVEGGTLKVKDGPFGEAKEVIGGFHILKADSYDHALKLCADHPHLRGEQTVEIRQVDFMGQPEP